MLVRSSTSSSLRRQSISLGRAPLALIVVAAVVALTTSSPARAATAPIVADAMAMPAATATPADGHPTDAEAAFVKGVQADLTRRFATEAEAEKAGYLRYTDEDETGAISFANRKWSSADARHPSQLWYDVGGRLLGADFSVLKADSPQAPSRFGVAPARWGTFHAHVHYGLIGPDGANVYGAVGKTAIEKAGGTLANPTAAELVKAGVAKDAKQVAFVFAFPAIWDLTVWVLPNSAGAFADTNPDVHPVHPAKGD